MPVSGKYGVVEDTSGIGVISDVRQWNINQTVDSKSFGASNLKGGTNRRAGLLDWTGSFMRSDKFPNALLMPGLDINFRGYVGNGIAPNALGLTQSGLAFIDSLNVEWNWETNELQTLTYNMMSQASILAQSQAAQNDTTNPARAIQSAKAVVQIATATDSFTKFVPVCVRQASLNLLANPQNSSTSCTVVTGPFQTQRRLAGLADWNLSLVMDAITTNPFHSGLAPPAPPPGGNDVTWSPGDFVIIRILPDFVAVPTEFWELKYGFVNDVTNFTVNIETGELVSYTFNISMAVDFGFDTSPADSVVSFPATPNGTWWPTAPV